MSKSTVRMANSVDPDQTAPVRVYTAQTYLSEYLALIYILYK